MNHSNSTNSTIEQDFEDLENSTNYSSIFDLPNATDKPETAATVPPLKEYDFLNPIWNVAFSGTVITGTLGNLIVLWIVLGHKRMWTSTNYFLVNLSFTDLLMTILNGLFNFIYMRDNNWPFGAIYCTINNFVAYYTVIASVLTLTAITLDRYRAIIFPLKPKPGRWVIVGAIVTIWVSSALLSLPSILYSKTYSNTKITICLIVWPDGFAHHSKTDYIYNIVFFLITYIVPLTLMAMCYSRMGCHLWGKKTIGEENETLRQNYQKKKKVVKMFGFVVVAFAVCWLPYHIYFLYTYHNKDVVRMAVTKHVYLGIYWMAMINTSINPLIYFWMNNKFRNYFLKAIFFLPRLCFGKDCCKTAAQATPPVTQAGLNSQRNSVRQMRSNSQRSTNTTNTRISSNRTSMNTVINGAIVTESLLNAQREGRDLSMDFGAGHTSPESNNSNPTMRTNCQQQISEVAAAAAVSSNQLTLPILISSSPREREPNHVRIGESPEQIDDMEDHDESPSRPLTDTTCWVEMRPCTGITTL